MLRPASQNPAYIHREPPDESVSLSSAELLIMRDRDYFPDKRLGEFILPLLPDYPDN